MTQWLAVDNATGLSCFLASLWHAHACAHDDAWVSRDHHLPVRRTWNSAMFSTTIPIYTGPGGQSSSYTVPDIMLHPSEVHMLSLRRFGRWHTQCSCAWIASASDLAERCGVHNMPAQAQTSADRLQLIFMTSKGLYLAGT